MTNNHLNIERLLAYASGDLNEDERRSVETALEGSPEARAIVTRYRTIREAVAADRGETPPGELVARAKAIFREAPTYGWWETLDRIIATLLFDSRPQLAMAGFRGVAQGFQLSFESNLVNVDVQAEPVEKGVFDREPTRWSVMGQIESVSDVGGCGVALLRPGSRVPVAETRTDATGVFALEVPADHYELFLKVPSGTVVLPNIDMS